MENRTDVVNVLQHPCYEMIDSSYKLTATPSITCVMLYGFLMLLSVVTVCGNLLVVISVIYFKQLHTPTNTLILSLAVADMLVGILVFPLSMAFSLSSCTYNEDFLCKVRDTFHILFCTCSITHLCCISADRYYAVCQPLTYRSKISRHVVAIMIAASWGVAVLTGIGVVIPRLSLGKCVDACVHDVITASIIGPVLSFYLPVVVMLCNYLKIFLVAQRQARSIQSMKSGATASKMERKATKTLAIVLGVFLLCWTPFFFFITLLPLGNHLVPVAVIETVTWLGLSNSALNPIIYAFFYSWFRSAFKIIVSGKILKGNFVNFKLQ
ncbi:trace amine-associated receptor 1-like [Poeciliopsis prolifica]|uniref:trace amine-associated receptor 1-like n=1 Tax=Poeciliopsis prolifica TaxID=188132 RepID=UPI0024132D41|nr:trace amine-associated receptor 1-like [Poeciliopsis prolifica]